MAIVEIHGRVSPLDDKDFKAIKKKSGLAAFTVAEDFSWVRMVGSKSQVYSALILLKDKDSFLADFGHRGNLIECAEGEMPIYRSDLRKIMRDQVDKAFVAALVENKLCKRLGRQAQRKATPKTTSVQVKNSVAEILECKKCLESNRVQFDLCTVVTANSQREETKWTEER